MKTAGSSLKLMVATFVVALAGMATSTAYAMPGGPEGGPHGGGHGGMMGMAPRMLDAVNATPDQRAQIKQIMDAAHADMKAQHDAGRALHQQAMQIFTQPTVDANAAEGVRQQMLAQHDRASKRMMQAMLDVSRVLTPDQRKQLADKMAQRKSMMERHMQERRALDQPKK